MASSRISGARLDSLWQHAREPAFWLGPDLRLIWVNKAWEELTGYPVLATIPAHAPPEISGQIIQDLWPMEFVQGESDGPPLR